jgi:hypothetical protein
MSCPSVATGAMDRTLRTVRALFSHTQGCLGVLILWNGSLTCLGALWTIMRARCYPFKMPKRRFHSLNPQAYLFSNHMCCILMKYHVHTTLYKFILMMYLVHVQDTVLVVPPYPYCIKQDRIYVPLEDGWYERPKPLTYTLMGCADVVALDGRCSSNVSVTVAVLALKATPGWSYG